MVEVNGKLDGRRMSIQRVPWETGFHTSSDLILSVAGSVQKFIFPSVFHRSSSHMCNCAGVVSDVQLADKAVPISYLIKGE